MKPTYICTYICIYQQLNTVLENITLFCDRIDILHISTPGFAALRSADSCFDDRPVHSWLACTILSYLLHSNPGDFLL